ncbi:MAG: bis(5'-nucleosyl)-tetraphosphatase (symmetrical) YqeK [Lactobacillales bacterium]|jgi:predicted HD superfamily hydrolase involved in NAD metabolism|nr:bis(5'-nucleosyl)-tetraphosphatase (symmetrical) YqeK [Lactobacillales bacterium]
MEMNEYEKYTAFSRDELLSKVEESMSEKRFSHVLGTQETAIQLAKRFGADVEKASIAGLVHDYAKERPNEEMIRVIVENHLGEDIIPFGNQIWHGIAGIVLIEKELGIRDSEILQAVYVHTTGSSNMSLIDKIIYVADYIEPHRHFEDVSEVRRLAEVDLDEVVKYETEHTLLRLIKEKRAIYPKTIETFNRYVVGMQ